MVDSSGITLLVAPQEAIKNYKVEREVVAVVEDPLLTLRNSLTYGKLVVQRSTTAYEYYSAHFSAPMPREWLPLAVTEDIEACALDGTEEDMSGRMVVALRGNCSFLDKSTNVSKVGASALIMVNNASDLFQIAAGYATGATSGSGPNGPHLPVIMIKRHALLALQRGISAFKSEARMIPLRCPPGDTNCVAILPDEIDVPLEVDSGFLHIGALRFEFLSGTWGGILPGGALNIHVATPRDACGPLGPLPEGSVVVTVRGGCGFGDKAINSQAAGASAFVVVDRPDAALLRIGATQDQAEQIAIPGMLVSHATGEYMFNGGSDSALTIVPEPGMASEWLELGLATWPDKEAAFDVVHRQLKQRNAKSTERLQWLENKKKALFGASPGAAEL